LGWFFSRFSCVFAGDGHGSSFCVGCVGIILNGVGREFAGLGLELFGENSMKGFVCPESEVGFSNDLYIYIVSCD